MYPFLEKAVAVDKVFFVANNPNFLNIVLFLPPKFQKVNANCSLSPKIQAHFQRQNLGRKKNQGSAWHGLWPGAQLRRSVATVGRLGRAERNCQRRL